MVRELLTRRIVAPLVDAVRGEDAPLRAALLGSQVVGLIMARYVVAIEPLAAAADDRLVAALAPVFQRLLTEPLR